MCFVLGRIFGVWAISAVPSLSSKTVHVMIGLVHPMEMFLDLSSSMSSMRGMTLQRTLDSPMYSLSVVLSAISVWSWEAHAMGIPRYVMTYPCLDLAVSLSCSAIVASQLPAKSASTYTMNGSSFIVACMPLVRVPCRYLPSHFIACVCSVLGFSQNRAHWWVA